MNDPLFEMQDGRVRVMREYMDTHKGYRMIFGDEPAREIVARARPVAQA